MVSASMNELFLWLVVGGAIVGPPAAFLGFLWFFQATRSEFTTTMVCPEKGERAAIDVITRHGEQGPYRDIRSCTLLDDESASCDKACLKPDEVLEEPFKR